MPVPGPIRRLLVVFLIFLLPLAAIAQSWPKPVPAHAATAHMNHLPTIVADFVHAGGDDCGADCDHTPDAPFGDVQDAMNADPRIAPAALSGRMTLAPPSSPRCNPAYPPIKPPPAR